MNKSGGCTMTSCNNHGKDKIPKTGKQSQQSKWQHQQQQQTQYREREREREREKEKEKERSTILQFTPLK